MDNQQDLAQQSLTKENKSFFQQVIDCLKNTQNLIDILKHINNELDNSNFDDDALKYVGMLSFVIGNDYASQRYLQKQVLINVEKRIREIELSQEILDIYSEIIYKLSKLDYHKLIEANAVKYRDLIESKVPNTPQNKIIFAQMKNFLNYTDIPMSLANGVFELKQEPLTYQKILQFNSVITEQAIYAGSGINKYVKLYGNEVFRSLLEKAVEYFSNGKFSFIYTDITESIVASTERFKLTFNANNLSDEDFEKFKSDYEKTLPVQEESKQQQKTFTSEEAKNLMENDPNGFIFEVLKDLGIDDISDETQYIFAIESLLQDLDYLQNIYSYLCKNQDNPKRLTVIDNQITINNIKRITEVLHEKAKEYSIEYKKFVELNCAEIPAIQQPRIVKYVNDLIECCLLETDDQKQYLTSQVIENGITTWQHLQQIIDIIETCKISGCDVDYYHDFHRYCNEKTCIKEIYENSDKIEILQNKISIINAFYKWFDLIVKTASKE